MKQIFSTNFHERNFMSYILKRSSLLTALIIPLIATAPITAKTEAHFTLTTSYDDFKNTMGTIAGACLVGAGLGLVGACIYGLCNKSDEQVLDEAEQIYNKLSSYYHDVLKLYQTTYYHAYDKEYQLKSAIIRNSPHYHYFNNCCPVVRYKFVDFKCVLDDNVSSVSSSYQTVNNRIAKIKNNLHTHYYDYIECNHYEHLVNELEKVSYKQSILLDILHKIQADVEILPEYRAEIREKRLEEKQREFDREMKKREQELREREDRLYQRR